MTEKMVHISGVYLSPFIFTFDQDLVRLPKKPKKISFFSKWNFVLWNLLFKILCSVLSFIFCWSLKAHVVCLIHLKLDNLVHSCSVIVPLDHHGGVQGAASTKSRPPSSRGSSLWTRSNPSSVSSIPRLCCCPLDNNLLVIWSSLCVTIAGIVSRLPPLR